MSSLAMAQTSTPKSDPKAKSIPKSGKAKSTPRPKPKPLPAWSMFPSLHPSVSDLLSPSNHTYIFHPPDNSSGCIQSYDTNIMGIFHCHSRQCGSNTWSSKKIAITIRQYHENRYNVRVYHQRCLACNKIAKPKLDDSYAERVAYRLLKWSGVEQEKPMFNGESKGPHLSDLCEGCRAGHCADGDRDAGLGELTARMGRVSLGGRRG